MKSLYNNERFTKAQATVELAERDIMIASQEHLTEVLKRTVEDVIMITKDTPSDNQGFLIENSIRQAMIEAISTREATASYKRQLSI